MKYLFPVLFVLFLYGCGEVPVADAGSDKTVHVTDIVHLQASSDSTEADLTYLWTFSKKPADSNATLSKHTTATPSFTPDKVGEYTLSLVISNSAGPSAKSYVTITATNASPVITAATLQNSFGVIDLIGLALDADDDNLTYSWSVLSSPSGSHAYFGNNATLNTPFSMDAIGTYTVQLAVSDGIESTTTTLTIATTSTVPKVSAGLEQSIHPVSSVNLSATASDADGDTLSYNWKLLLTPVGSTASISSATTLTSSFSADVPGDYLVEFSADDGHTSVSDMVVIHSVNQAPVADAGADRVVPKSTTITLDATQSLDADSDPLSYSWDLASKPQGSLAALSSTTIVNPTFVADQEGNYTINLIVNDGFENSQAATIVITAQNTQPVADAGSNQEALVGDTISLDANNSSDANGDSLSYTWSIVSTPTNSALTTVTGATTRTPSLIPDVAGDFVIGLVVSDGTLESTQSLVTITTYLKPQAFAMLLDVNASTASANWKSASSAASIATAVVSTQGQYGSFVITGDTISYLKTQETNVTDTAVIEVSTASKTAQINVDASTLFWKSIVTNTTHSAGIKSDGTLWLWGSNSTGQLGDDTYVDTSTPVQEASHSSNWKVVCVGYAKTSAIKTDGTLWNFGGYKKIPTQEETNATNWKTVSSGHFHTVAIKTDGTLWSWGSSNTFGQLGNTLALTNNTAIQEATNATNWAHVSAGKFHTTAIKTDGTLWSWGYNVNRQLADGTTNNSFSPIQEETYATDWAQVSANYYYTNAIKTDGTLWTLGNSVVGIQQEGTHATDWKSVSAGKYFSVAIKTDGSIWSWGSNEYGQLGDGNFKLFYT